MVFLGRTAGLLAAVLASAAAMEAAETAKGKSDPVTPTGQVNRLLPSWLKLGGEARFRGEGVSAAAFRPDTGDVFLLSRIRMDLGVTPSPWLRFQFQAQDSRVLGLRTRPAPASVKDALDLRVAYVELGREEGQPLTLRVGRQSLVFGQGRLVADPAWSNTGRTFDAVRAIFRRGRYRLDAFAASVVVPKDGEFNRHRDGDNFHGLYGTIQNPVPGATLEPYVFWRLAPTVTSEAGTRGKHDLKTVGFHWNGKLPSKFDYNVEMALQRGDRAGDRVAAWAGHWVVGRTLAKMRWQPRLFAEYNQASGDARRRDGTWGTFDQLYPSAHDKFGLADQFMWSNLRHLRGGGELKVSKRVALSSSFHGFWLANPRDALYAPGGKVVAQIADGSAGRHAASEWDGQGLITLSRTTQLNAGYARIFAGNVLRRAIPGCGAYNAGFLNLAHRF
jgi:hypothetical protein